MTAFTEGDLQIVFPSTAAGRKFDDMSVHGLSHCMKAVDFVVELNDKVLFIEFKDPENPHARAENSSAFMEKFRSGRLDDELKTKYRDSWLYEWAQERITKPTVYLVLIGASTLSAAELITRTDALKRQLPLTDSNGQPWKRPFVAGCAVMNLVMWNKKFPQFTVSRISNASQ